MLMKHNPSTAPALHSLCDPKGLSGYSYVVIESLFKTHPSAVSMRLRQLGYTALRRTQFVLQCVHLFSHHIVELSTAAYGICASQ